MFPPIVPKKVNSEVFCADVACKVKGQFTESGVDIDAPDNVRMCETEAFPCVTIVKPVDKVCPVKVEPSTASPVVKVIDGGTVVVTVVAGKVVVTVVVGVVVAVIVVVVVVVTVVVGVTVVVCVVVTGVVTVVVI